MASSFDNETEEQFETRMNTMLDNSMATLCMVLGHRLGLYELLVKLKEPQTPQQLAKAAGMKTRYVEEWVGAMFCAHVLEVDKTGSEDRFFIPAKRIPYLTHKENSGVSHMVPLMAGVYEDIVKCFPLDGQRGVPYERYPFFNQWRSMEGDAVYTPEFLSEVFQQYQPLDHKMKSKARVLSLGCNVGKVELVLAKLYPTATIVGIDIGEDGVAQAVKNAQVEGVSNTSFKVQDACHMPADWTESFDVVVAVDVLHDLPFTTKCMAESFRITKPDGLFVVLDIEGHSRISDNRDTVFGCSLYTCSLFHCMPVSLNVEGGEGLGTMWGVEKAKEMLDTAGFHTHYEANITKQFNHLFICGKNKL